MKSTYLLFFLPAAFLFAACSHHAETTGAKHDAAVPVSEFVVHPASSAVAVRLPAEIRPYEEVDIFAKLNSYVREVLVDRGSIVKKGDLLIQLDAPEVEAQVAEAASKMETAASMALASDQNYRRLLQTSHTPGAVSLNDLDQAHAKMKADSAVAVSAKAAYQALCDMRDYLHITAPFDGVITERNISPGAFVGPSAKSMDKPLLRLEEVSRLRIEVAIPESESGKNFSAAACPFSVTAFPGEQFTGKFSRRAQSLSQHIRSEMAEIDFDNPDGKLKPGMYAEVDLQSQRTDSCMLVPATAVVSSTQGIFVVRDNNGKAEWVSVRKGELNSGNLLEVFGALRDGDHIVTDASEEIRPGTALAGTMAPVQSANESVKK